MRQVSYDATVSRLAPFSRMAAPTAITATNRSTRWRDEILSQWERAGRRCLVQHRNTLRHLMSSVGKAAMIGGACGYLLVTLALEVFTAGNLSFLIGLMTGLP